MAMEHETCLDSSSQVKLSAESAADIFDIFDKILGLHYIRRRLLF